MGGANIYIQLSARRDGVYDASWLGHMGVGVTIEGVVG